VRAGEKQMEATIIIVENDDDHKKAMDLISRLMSATAHEDIARLNAQAREVEAYESVRWPRELASVPEIISYLMEQHDLTRNDLAPLFGGRGRVSDVLNGKRTLSIGTVKKLRERFGVSADILIPREEKIRELACVQ
jgi:HTH-type transcriptional regulator/antitoxin HigA